MKVLHIILGISRKAGGSSRSSQGLVVHQYWLKWTQELVKALNADSVGA